MGVLRAGMVYVQPSLLGWKPIVTSWMQRLPATYDERQKHQIQALCDWLLPPALRLVTKYLKQMLVTQEQVCILSQCCIHVLGPSPTVY